MDNLINMDVNIQNDDIGNDLISIFNEKFNTFKSSIKNSKYIIEVTKTCGYSDFILMYKDNTLLDLYKNISLQFECRDIKQLFILNETTLERINIPITEKITLRQYISENNNTTLKPLYPVECPVVYRIYFDDGHHHH